MDLDPKPVDAGLEREELAVILTTGQGEPPGHVVVGGEKLLAGYVVVVVLGLRVEGHVIRVR